MEKYINAVYGIKEMSRTRKSAAQRLEPRHLEELNLSIDNELKNMLHREAGQDVYNYISTHLDLANTSNIVVTTPEKTYADVLDADNIRSIISLKKFNRISNLNEHLRNVNTLLEDAGTFIGCVETYDERKQRFYSKYGYKLTKILSAVDFVVNRVIPRLNGINKIYNLFTKSKILALSKAEALGRLVYCGFEIIEFKVINNLLYFVAIKTKEPSTEGNPSFHPLIKLRRVGKNGKLIGVYKMRTMHPYSEYLQDFVVKLNGYNKVGKPANDFRVAPWGKFLRKLWLDEFPQLINLLKGEMKIVGVRPLSRVRFNELPTSVQEARVNHKPGCFPPYVALCMPDSKQNIEAEIIYMAEKEQSPYTTDLKYLWLSVYNILANKIRSS